MEKVVLKGYVLVPEQEIGTVLEDELDKNRLNVYEEFIDSLAFSKHQERVASSKWGNL